MSDKASNTATQMLEMLRADYARRAPAEIARLTALAERLCTEAPRREVLAELREGLHKLAGSAGSFGLPDLGSNARSLESHATRWLDGDVNTVDANSWFSLAAGVASLAAILEEAAAPAAPHPSPSPHAAPSAVEGREERQVWHLLDPGDEALALSIGQFGYLTRGFDTLDALFAALDAAPGEGGRPDAMVCSVTAGGHDTLAAFGTRGALPCPLLLVASEDRLAQRAEAVRLGASAYLLRPLDAGTLADHLDRATATRQEAAFRVLIVDDDADLARHYQLVLEVAGIEVQALADPSQIVEQVAAFRPEMVLLDLNMPGYSGWELAGILRQYEEWVGLPIVYLSAETDPARQLDAMSQGADDFLVKPISDTYLVSAVRVRAARFRQLADLVTKDSLTGLLRHARIKEEIAVQWARAHRAGRSLCVAMIDIDHFKSINDTYGHATGDRVLKVVARLLRQRLRRSDSIGRYGGEEFAAVMPDCDAATARSILDDLRLRFAELRFRHEDREFGATLSAGVACVTTHPNANADELLALADAALYEAKHGGRNQVRVAP